MFVKIPQNLQENICPKVSFYNKATASLNTESGQVFYYEFCEIFKNIYFTNVCEGLPLKSKIFTGVSFRKMLDFYYKQNR